MEALRPRTVIAMPSKSPVNGSTQGFVDLAPQVAFRRWAVYVSVILHFSQHSKDMVKPNSASRPNTVLPALTITTSSIDHAPEAKRITSPITGQVIS